MSTKLHRMFPTRERFVEEFVRRLSERGIELNLPGEQAPPTGTVLHLDLRLEDGTPLIVGTGEVTEGGNPGDAFRVRFLELSKQSRAHLGELAVKAASIPASRRRPASAASSQSLVDLVAETYGSDIPPGMTDNSAVMVPPDATATATGTAQVPTPAQVQAATGPAPATPAQPEPAGAPAPKSKRSGRKTQISPGVIVIAIIAGAAGAAAQAWFDDMADFVWHLRDDTESVGQTALADLLPTDIAPSDFSADEEFTAGAQGDPLAQTGGESQPEGEGATGGTPEANAGPPPEGSTADPEAAQDGAEGSTLDLSPADRVRLITWEAGVDSTVITLWGNGSFLTKRVSYFEIPGGQPRMLIKLRGIDLPYRETVLALDTPEVTRLRTGFHPQSRVNELHLVLDLATSDVSIERMERGESSLSFYLGPNLGDGADAVPTE